MPALYQAQGAECACTLPKFIDFIYLICYSITVNLKEREMTFDFTTLQILALASLVAIPVFITMSGTLISILFGKRRDGWSHTVALTCLIAMSAMALLTFYEIEKARNVELGVHYTIIILWFVYMFLFVQPWMVKFIRKNWLSNRPTNLSH